MTATDPLTTYRAALRNYPPNQAGAHPAYVRRDDTNPTPARQLVLEFLRNRLAANNARITFLLNPSTDNMTAWANAENKAAGDDNDECHNKHRP